MIKAQMYVFNICNEIFDKKTVTDGIKSNVNMRFSFESSLLHTSNVRRSTRNDGIKAVIFVLSNGTNSEFYVKMFIFCNVLIDILAKHI